MSYIPRLKLPKKLLLQPREYKWASKMIYLARRYPKLRNSIIEYQIGSMPTLPIKLPAEIVKHDAVAWVVYVTQHILLTPGARIEKDKFGHRYTNCYSFGGVIFEPLERE